MKRFALGLIVGVAACGGGSSGTSDGGADALIVDGTGVVVDGTPAGDAAPTTRSSWAIADGLPDQIPCAPWVLNDTSEPEEPALGTELVLGNDSDGEAMFYRHGDEVLTFPALFVMEATVRFVSSTSQGPSRTGVMFAATFDDDTKQLVQLSSTGVFVLADEGTAGVTFTGATDDAFHTYRLEIDTTTGALEVFRDDVSIITSTTIASPNDEVDGVFFGEASIVAHGTSEWTAVSHNALTPIACD